MTDGLDPWNAPTVAGDATSAGRPVPGRSTPAPEKTPVGVGTPVDDATWIAWVKADRRLFEAALRNRDHLAWRGDLQKRNDEVLWSWGIRADSAVTVVSRDDLHEQLKALGQRRLAPRYEREGVLNPAVPVSLRVTLDVSGETSGDLGRELVKAGLVRTSQPRPYTGQGYGDEWILEQGPPGRLRLVSPRMSGDVPEWWDELLVAINAVQSAGGAEGSRVEVSVSHAGLQGRGSVARIKEIASSFSDLLARLAGGVPVGIGTPLMVSEKGTTAPGLWLPELNAFGVQEWIRLVTDIVIAGRCSDAEIPCCGLATGAHAEVRNAGGVDPDPEDRALRLLSLVTSREMSHLLPLYQMWYGYTDWQHPEVSTVVRHPGPQPVVVTRSRSVRPARIEVTAPGTVEGPISRADWDRFCGGILPGYVAKTFLNDTIHHGLREAALGASLRPISAVSPFAIRLPVKGTNPHTLGKPLTELGLTVKPGLLPANSGPVGSWAVAGDIVDDCAVLTPWLTRADDLEHVLEALRALGAEGLSEMKMVVKVSLGEAARQRLDREIAQSADVLWRLAGGSGLMPFAAISASGLSFPSLRWPQETEDLMANVWLAQAVVSKILAPLPIEFPTRPAAPLGASLASAHAPDGPDPDHNDWLFRMWLTETVGPLASRDVLLRAYRRYMTTDWVP